jgi:ABC-type multidrug transport system fused ATPase/permease subunit
MQQRPLKVATTNRFASQIVTLTKKNVLVISRKPLFMLMYICAPALFVFLLWWVQVSGVKGATGTSDVKIEMEPCSRFTVYGQASTQAPCVRLAFAPANYSDTMRIVARNAGLEYGVDIEAYDSAELLADAIYDDIGRIEAAVVFNGTRSYDIWANVTMSMQFTGLGMNPLYDTFGEDGRTLSVQHAVNQAIVEVATRSKTDISLTAAAFTKLKDDADDNDYYSSIGIVRLTGTLITTLGVIIATLNVMYTIAGEKQEGLLGSMRQMGMSEAAYWVSWFLLFLCVAALGAMLAVGAGRASGLLVFANVDFSLMFMVLWSFQLAMSSLAMMIGAVVSSANRLNICAFFCIVISLLEAVFFSASGLYPRILAAQHRLIAVHILNILRPWFSFGGAFNLILAAVGERGQSTGGGTETHLDWYAWGDAHVCLDENAKPQDPRIPCYATVSSCIADMTIAVPIYLFLAWYLSQISSDGTGSPERAWFIFDPVYWGLRKRSRQEAQDGETVELEMQASAREGSVRTHKLSKAYPKLTALKEVSLVMKCGELTALLGQNGNRANRHIITTACH